MQKTLIISTIVAIVVLFVGGGLYYRSFVSPIKQLAELGNFGVLETDKLVLSIEVPKTEYVVGESFGGSYRIRYDGLTGKALMAYKILYKRSNDAPAEYLDFNEESFGFAILPILNSNGEPVVDDQIRIYEKVIEEAGWNIRMVNSSVPGEYIFTAPGEYQLSFSVYDCIANEAIIKKNSQKDCKSIESTEIKNLEQLLYLPLKSVQKTIIVKSKESTSTPVKKQPIKTEAKQAQVCANFDCLIKAAQTCSPAKTSPSFSYGEDIIITGPYEIKGKDSQNRCVWSFGFSSIEGLDIAEAQADEEGKALIGNIKKMIGTETICKYSRGVEMDSLPDFFTTLKNGELSWMFLVGAPSGSSCATTKNGTPFQF